MYIPIRSALESHDVARLISACENARDKLVILALVEAGLRARELGRVQPGDIEWDQRALRVAGRAEVVPLSETLLGLFRLIFEKRSTLRLGNRQIQRIVRAVGARAGHEKPVTPDVLRRTWQQQAAATAAARNGVRVLESAAEAAPDVILVAGAAIEDLPSAQTSFERALRFRTTVFALVGDVLEALGKQDRGDFRYRHLAFAIRADLHSALFARIAPRQLARRTDAVAFDIIC